MQDASVLVGHRPVVHLATGTVVGWRFGRTRPPADAIALDMHLAAAVRQIADTLVATDGGRRSMRFGVIEAAIDEAPCLLQHLEHTIAERGLPGPRFGLVFPGHEIVARVDRHPHLRRLVGLGVGVGFDSADLSSVSAPIQDGLPFTRLRLRLPLRASGVTELPCDDDARTALREQELAAVVDLARRNGVRVTMTGIDTAEQELVARRAGADLGAGDHLGPVCEVPVMTVRADEGTLATVQRLTHAVHGRREHAWASAGS